MMTFCFLVRDTSSAFIRRYMRASFIHALLLCCLAWAAGGVLGQ